MGIKNSTSTLSTQFEEIYSSYYERLFAFALVITNSEADAQDVVSQVYYTLWEKQKNLSEIKDLKAYLFTSVKNQAVRHIANDRYFHTEDIEEVLLSIDQVDPEELMIGKELEGFIDQAIMNLPDQCGLVFRLSRDKNMDQKEIAAELGISKYTVKYHMETALKKIMGELKSKFPESKVIKWMSAGAALLMLSQILTQ
ncbi:MAG: RNA polymerase sigma-70 factor [Cyclobacteriaceae bacterium]|nr:RNA polymerase sigma-70 factor [Cyclobacteriaceae bacterium SS2]